MKIPAHGRSRADVLGTLDAYRAHDLDWRDGRTFAYVYDAGEEANSVVRDAFASFLVENALDPTVYPSLLRLENEIVAMMASHLGAENAVGSFTSGGTESILLALKSARDHARRTRPAVIRPEVVLPNTAHAAFHKAAHYLGLEVRVTPVDAGFRADVDAMRAAITDQTILLVGSAFSYAHGVVDPIPAIAGLAREKGLLCHVDGCIGGFVLPYFRRLGAKIVDFDLSVPGVTSISCDLHKYGFAAKGASVVLYNDPALREAQIYACSGWNGYTIVNTTVQSTKSGGPLAGAFAALHFLGDDGYLALAERMLDAARRLRDGLRGIGGLYPTSDPEGNLLAFASDEVSVFHLVDEMRLRGFYVQPQLSFARSPATLHLSVHPFAGPQVDALVAAMRESAEAARALPHGAIRARTHALVAERSGALGEADLGELLALAGVRGDALPSRMASVNELLDALPTAAREALLAGYVNALYVHREPAA